MLEQALLAEINSLSEFTASSLFDDNDDIASIEYFQNRSTTKDFEYFFNGESYQCLILQMVPKHNRPI